LLVEHLTRLFGAAAALGGHAQFALEIAKAARAALDAAANLAFGDAVAETDVHGCSSCRLW
jgi:hypothetical protein